MTHPGLIQFNRQDLRLIRKQIIQAIEAIDRQVDHLDTLTSSKFKAEIPLDPAWSTHATATYDEMVDKYVNYVGASMQTLVETKLALLGLGQEIQKFYLKTMINDQSVLQNTIGEATSAVRWVQDRIL